MLRFRLAPLAALSIWLASCSWNNGPDCPKACDLAQKCTDLHATYALSCSSLAGGCYDQAAACAVCITTGGTTCSDLVAGKCDSVCVIDYDAGTDGGDEDAGSDGGP
jgi:hypothetical protein